MKYFSQIRFLLTSFCFININLIFSFSLQSKSQYNLIKEKGYNDDCHQILQTLFTRNSQVTTRFIGHPCMWFLWWCHYPLHTNKVRQWMKKLLFLFFEMALTTLKCHLQHILEEFFRNNHVVDTECPKKSVC